MKTEIEPCVCTPDYDSARDMHDGMPILFPSPSMKFWEIKCPKCGRGGLLEFKSPYLAVMGWNDMQKKLKGEQM